MFFPTRELGSPLLWSFGGGGTLIVSLHCTALPCTLHTSLHCPALHCTVQNCTAMQWNALEFDSPHLHWIAPKWSAVQCNAPLSLHWTALHRKRGNPATVKIGISTNALLGGYSLMMSCTLRDFLPSPFQESHLFSTSILHHLCFKQAQPKIWAWRSIGFEKSFSFHISLVVRAFDLSKT